LRSPGVSAADGQGKKGLEEQDDDMFGLTPYFVGQRSRFAYGEAVDAGPDAFCVREDQPRYI
jgi:hypothetical protein